MYRRKYRRFRRTPKSDKAIAKFVYAKNLVTDTLGEFFIGVNFNGAVDNLGAPDDAALMCIVNNSYTGSATGVPFQHVDKWKSLYGQCRVAAVKIKYIPAKGNNTSQTSLTGQAQPVEWNPAVAHFDTDGYEVEYANWAQTKMLEEGKSRLLNMNRPWKIYKKSMKYKLNSKYWSRPPIGAGVTTSHQNMPGMWHGVGDALSKTNGKYGCHIAIQGEGLPKSTTNPSPELPYALGTIIYTLYVQYGDKL